MGVGYYSVHYRLSAYPDNLINNCTYCTHCRADISSLSKFSWQYQSSRV